MEKSLHNVRYRKMGWSCTVGWSWTKIPSELYSIIKKIFFFLNNKKVWIFLVLPTYRNCKLITRSLTIYSNFDSWPSFFLSDVTRLRNSWTNHMGVLSVGQKSHFEFLLTKTRRLSINEFVEWQFIQTGWLAFIYFLSFDLIKKIKLAHEYKIYKKKRKINKNFINWQDLYTFQQKRG